MLPRLSTIFSVGTVCAALLMGCRKNQSDHTGIYTFESMDNIGGQIATSTQLMLYRNGKAYLESMTEGQTVGIGTTPVHKMVIGQGTWSSVSKMNVEADITITHFQTNGERSKVKNNPIKAKLTVFSNMNVERSIQTIEGTDGAYTFDVFGVRGSRVPLQNQ